jgi:glycosyltransferase involved in cell wall biosynthesis
MPHDILGHEEMRQVRNMSTARRPVPRYSICIPVHNRPEYLQQAVRSALAQTEQDFEVIVSDDCSTVDLRPALEALGDPRIQFDRSDERLGASRNHQRAVSLARGQFVQVLHSDDLLVSNCLATAGEALDRCEAAAAVYFSCTYLTAQGLDGFHPTPRLPFADEKIYSANPWLEKFHGVGPSCCLFRKSAFDRIGGYRTSLKLAYDWDFYMRLLSSGGGVLFLPRILTIYRRHEEQAIELHTLAGLQDMLELWRLREHEHWPASEIAELLLSATLFAARKRQDWRAPAGAVWRSGLAARVLSGLPGALARRAARRARLFSDDAEATLRAPERLEESMDLADRTLATVQSELGSLA